MTLFLQLPSAGITGMRHQGGLTLYGLSNAGLHAYPASALPTSLYPQAPLPLMFMLLPSGQTSR